MPQLDQTSALRGAALGAASGIAATAVMTVGLAGAKAVGLLGEPPPRKLTRRILGRLGVRLGRTTLDATTLLSHFGYGAACGALYGVGVRRRAGVGSGALFGLAVWAASYKAWIPALGLMPPPAFDRPGRPTVMALAHLLFGGALGAAQRWSSTRALSSHAPSVNP